MNTSQSFGLQADPGVEFFFVDVFASRPLTGNPVTLVPDADALEEGQMRSLAREFNQSETAFLLRPTRPGAQSRLRSFTPAGAEVGGAGHNALGAWLWLAHAGHVGAGSFIQEIGDEMLPVEVVKCQHEPTRVAMTQYPPEFGRILDATVRLASALGIDERDLYGSLACQVVSTGVPHLLVPVCTARWLTGSAPTLGHCWACWQRLAPRAATSTPPMAGTVTAATRMPGSSTRRSGSPKIRPPERPPAHLRQLWCVWGGSSMAPWCTSSRDTPSVVQVACRSRCPAISYACPGPAWSSVRDG